MTKLFPQLFKNNILRWLLLGIACLQLLAISLLLIWLIFVVVLVFQVKGSIALVASTYAQTGELNLNPLPLAQLAAVNTQLLHWKKWDVLEKTAVITQLLLELQSSDQRLLLIFQGPDELRPTGGFMGAYGIATFQSGKLTNLTFEDIYDAAGQMQTKFEPPPGVAEYTSGGEGWRLTDANWDPDFPTAVQTILTMMQDAGKGEFTGVITINTTVLHDLLKITGSVPLPEYQTELSVDTVTTLLSAHREAFFAGSRAKVTMLQQSFTKMLYTLAKLSPRQHLAVGQLLMQALNTKSIQIWQRNPELQTQLVAAGAAGTLPAQSYIALVEANVGINKINSLIRRDILVWRDQNILHVRVVWHNTAPQTEQETTAPDKEIPTVNPDRKPFVGPAPEATHNAYINYIRLRSSPDVRPLSPSSELLIVPAGESLTKEYQFQALADTPIIFWKQPGVDDSQFSSTVGDITRTHLLTTDTSIPPDK